MFSSLPKISKLFSGTEECHNKNYDDYVYQRLQSTVQRYCYDRDKITETLHEIRSELVDGRLRLNKN